MRLIESEGVRTTEGYEVPTHYTHEQPATVIGSKRVPVSWAFAQLKEEGAVELRDRKLHVADLEVVKRAAEV